MFSYLRAEGYFNVDYESQDNVLKKYFTAQIPIYIHKDNCKYLSGDSFTLSSEEIKCYTIIVRSKRNNEGDQVQMSMINMDLTEFIEYR